MVAASFGPIKFLTRTSIKEHEAKVWYRRHLLRMDHDRIPKIELRWTRPGKRKQTRPRTTWRTTIAELKENRLTWGTLPMTGPSGGTSMLPYVPMGMKRITCVELLKS